MAIFRMIVSIIIGYFVESCLGSGTGIIAAAIIMWLSEGRDDSYVPEPDMS
jgi:hypothetical protein